MSINIVTMVESQRFEAFEIHGLGRKPFWVREWNLPQNELYSLIWSSWMLKGVFHD
jgi:hypothetical protein